MKAYVKVKTDAGFQGEVLAQLDNMKSLAEESPNKDADVIYGEYDIMVVVECDARRKFNEAIARIAKLSGVAGTNTISVMPREDVYETFLEKRR